ncbi:MAG: sugar-binding transcriptional regulator [Anaerolineae bacterium]|jgi:DNA-binding transcriptional regulator LsrR (DeoR family)
MNIRSPGAATMALSAEHHRLLYRIAQAYYVDESTQREIAERFRLSRPKVSRLLQQARDEGVIDIVLVPPPGDLADLEHQLEALYHLEEVALTPTPDRADVASVSRRLGRPGAECLIRSLDDNRTLAMSWGTTLSAVIDALPTRSWPNTQVVQMLGGLGDPAAESHGVDLTYRMAEKLGAKPRPVLSPGVVSDRSIRNALLRDAQVSGTLRLAASADVAVVGIGVPIPGSVVLQAGILTEADVDELKSRGAVGDIALRFIDGNGSAVDHEINGRTIALELEAIQAIPRVIGVAGGAQKLAVIRAALRGGLVDVLVTDQRTASALVAEADTATTR